LFCFADVAFYPDNYLRELVWIGMSGSFVRYMHDRRAWQLLQMGTGISATSDAAPASLLVGNLFSDYLLIAGSIKELNLFSIISQDIFGPSSSNKGSLSKQV
jgi:hypothetical protein